MASISFAVLSMCLSLFGVFIDDVDVCWMLCVCVCVWTTYIHMERNEKTTTTGPKTAPTLKTTATMAATTRR